MGEQYDALRHKGADESIQNTLMAINKAIDGAKAMVLEAREDVAADLQRLRESTHGLAMDMV